MTLNHVQIRKELAMYQLPINAASGVLQDLRKLPAFEDQTADESSSE